MAVLVRELGGGGSATAPVTVFRDSFNRASGGLGSNWASGTKWILSVSTAYVFTSPSISSTAAVAPCNGIQGLRWDHSAPTFNPVNSAPCWAIALPTANSLVNGKTQFSSARLCNTIRTGPSGNLFVGPAVFVDMGVEFFGSGYIMQITASTHNWEVDKIVSGTGTVLGSGGPIADGDVLSLQATVSAGAVTITAFQNSTLLLTAVDNVSPLAIGYPGFFGQALQQNPGVLRSEWVNYIGGLGPIQAF